MSPDVKQKQIERAVLEMVIDLHPDHLTPPELVLKVAGARDPSEGETILHAIRDLRGSGLLRYIGEVVAPTHAALRVAALLVWP
jgi:hypothetical protein